MILKGERKIGRNNVFSKFLLSCYSIIFSNSSLFYNKKAAVTSLGCCVAFFFKDKKGISPVVATALLIVVTVVSAVGFQGWYFQYSSDIFAGIERDSVSDSEIEIDSLVGNTLYVESEQNTTLNHLSIEGTSCDVNTSLSEGINSLDVSSCIEELGSGTVEVFAQGEDLTTSQEFFRDESESSGNDDSEDDLGITPSSLPTLGGTFISVWNTSENGTSENDQIELPLESDGYYNFTVKGSTLVGSPVQVTDYQDNVLNFSSEGIHEINITGDITGWRFNGNISPSPTFISDSRKLYEISQWGPLRVWNNGAYFKGSEHLDISATDSLELEYTHNLSEMFRRGISSDNFSVSGTINNWNTSDVTDMSSLFSGSSSFNQPLSDWNTSSVTDMGGMFYYTSSFNQSLNEWDTSSVTDMGLMFGRASSFNQPLDSWNTTNVLDMNSMFNYADSFNQNISSWCVEQIPSKPSDFDRYSGFWGSSNLQPDWGETC